MLCARQLLRTGLPTASPYSRGFLTRASAAGGGRRGRQNRRSKEEKREGPQQSESQRSVATAPAPAPAPEPPTEPAPEPPTDPAPDPPAASFTPETPPPSSSPPPPPPPPESPGPDAQESTSSNGEAPAEMFPADHDAKRFTLDPSVSRWQNYSNKWSSGLMANTSGAPGLSALQLGLSRLFNAVGSDISNNSTGGVDPQAAAYWALHVSRFGFFVTQAAAGLAAHQAYETVGDGRSSSGGGGPAPESTPLSRILSNAGGELGNRLIESVGAWEQDYAWIGEGAFKMPWDMVTPNKQYNPLVLLGRTLGFMDESVQTLKRRVRNTPDPIWLRGSMYPEYYAKGYHYQTDGWLSSRSAAIYDHSTETLFLGRQDAMQRSALVPISDYIAKSGQPLSEMKLLEVGAGTGRFHSFIKDNYPELPTVCSDLSPFYLQQARRNVRDWKVARQPNTRLGGVDDAGVMEYVQTPAEKLDMPDASVDIVVSVYMFHELPEDVRDMAAKEMYRVLKPGGLCVFCDSVQLGDRPEWNESMSAFTNFQEPNYTSYIKRDIGELFCKEGFQPGTKYVNSATKTLSFIKPGSTSS
ncbi:S-adenosyl-L-methionine-dependent methyltransferase [Dunaliella salina]|uniref:S-adenosyl-L-methionine-dependent methyltransferase n=1 Tax=Dunaliella salina TaxID=3046 RepID=A0ABQ7GBX9_DUNSA|nr:S-adenosyl-L-methionine-dependent methyltransferase [Dunaliella salina]|eukprot:KAF5832119.1 S-adenosyl-L-methionine-dependent methyltransferase [Dunaliella salina]